MSRRLAWVALGVVLAVALVVGAPSADNKADPVRRVVALEKQVRCPTCAGLSVAESETPLARSSRDEIARQVADGRTDDEIKQFFVGRYGNEALMSPPMTGVVRVALVLPVLVGIAGFVVVMWSVRRWQKVQNDGDPSDDDRRLVDEALKDTQ